MYMYMYVVQELYTAQCTSILQQLEDCDHHRVRIHHCRLI